MPLAPGEHIGPYLIAGLLGAGGMGEVYRAKDPRLGREVALKLLPAEKFSSPERRQRFLREARAAAALNHPHIVTIHDIAEDNGRLYVVMELIQGRTLDAWLAGRAAPWKTALTTAIGVASALEAAHGAGIIHRDLKPGNIMVDAAGRAKLLDFGLAKTTEAALSADSATETIAAGEVPVTEEGTVLGTISYMSPEQAQGLKVDVRSDLFAFGAVLYEMLTGARAFQSGTKISTITAILRDEPPPLAKIVPEAPRDLVKIVERCLRKDPARRYQTATDVKVALEDLKVESESSLPSPAPQPARRPIPWGAVAAGFGVVALIGAAFVWRKPNRESRPVVIRQVNTGMALAASPALSADGRMLAFSAPDETGQYDLYVKIIDAGDPLRLTRTATSESGPVWSPDASHLYFTRAPSAGQLSERTVHVVPALGGAERSITEGILQDVSPNGQSLLVERRELPAQPGGLFLVDAKGGTEVRLTTNTKESRDLNAVFSPESDSIFITRRPTGGRDQRLIRRTIRDGAETEVAVRGGRFLSLINLVADPSALLVRFQPDDGPARLGLVPIAGGEVEPIPTGEVVGSVTAARNGKRLILTQVKAEWRLWRGLRGPDAKVEGIGSRPVMTTMGSPAISPDGRRVAVSGALRNSREIWTGELASGLLEPLTSFKSSTTGSPAWSPDGQRIVFDARQATDPDLWMVAANGGTPERLTSQPGEDIVPVWTPDGQGILFTSGRSGRLELWRMPAKSGAEAVQVTREGGFAGRYSPDGQWIYYLKTRAGGQLWRVPSGGGREELVVAEVRSRNWALVPEGVLYLDTPEGGQTIGTLRLFRFATKRWENAGPTTARPVSILGIGLSPDGQSFYYTQRDEYRVDLMLVEGFR